MIAKTASLMEQFERRCAKIEQDQQVLTQRLAAMAEHIPGIVRQSADTHLQRISSNIAGSAREGLQQAVSGYEQGLNQSGAALKNQAATLNTELKRLEALHRHLILKVAAILTFGLGLLIMGTLYLSTHYRSVIEQNQVSAELLRAYNRADVTLCGDTLCANIDPKAKPYGSGKKTYHPVKPRQP
ncbi:relaxation protein [Solilutibacter pythonis]|uniref:relaxation protein n=1 Tax=Solilutibacter pythonis TaxID=2483112 RepID=UPI000EFC080B|nr:relaxation protein [Lysobacter pythonis]